MMEPKAEVAAGAAAFMNPRRVEVGVGDGELVVVVNMPPRIALTVTVCEAPFEREAGGVD